MTYHQPPPFPPLLSSSKPTSLIASKILNIPSYITPCIGDPVYELCMRTAERILFRSSPPPLGISGLMKELMIRLATDTATYIDAEIVPYNRDMTRPECARFALGFPSMVQAMVEHWFVIGGEVGEEVEEGYVSSEED